MIFSVMSPLALAMRIGLLTAALMGLVAQPGIAAEPTPENMGRLTAVSNVQALPSGLRIAIEPGKDDAEYGNAPLYIVVRDVLDRELSRRGFRVVGDSDTTIEIRIDITGFQARRRRSWDVFPGLPPAPGSEQSRSPVVHQFAVPLDSQSDSMPTKTSVVLVLFKPGKPPLWTATATAAGHSEAPDALVARLTRAAMSAFGTSIKRSFVLTCSDDARAGNAYCKE